MEAPGALMDTNSISSPSEPIKVAPVPLPLIDCFWGKAGQLLQRGIDNGAGELLLEDVYSRLQSQHMHLLLALDGQEILAAFVTEVVNYPRKRALRIVLAGGKSPERWKHQLREILHIGAKAIGATSVEVFGRPGWARIWKGDPHIRHMYTVIVEDI
jgi:hypothetical protein